MTARARTPPRVGAMCATPMRDAESLDETSLRRVVSFLSDAGVGIYLGSYGTGEGHLLRRSEITRLYEIGVDEAAGRSPVYAAALGFQSTDEVIELALEAAAIGVAAGQIHPPRPGPIAIQPTRAELDRYYDDVLGAIEAPVILTNQVVMVGYALPLDLVVDLLARHRHVTALNTSDRDDTGLAALVAAVDGRVPVHVGVVGQLVAALGFGAAGTVCFEANVLPHLCRAVVEAHDAGRREQMERAFALLLELHEVLSRYQNPRSVKAAMAHRGLIDSGALRRPYLALGGDAQRDVVDAVDRVDAAARTVLGR